MTAPYCVRCGIPHDPKYTCLRDSEKEALGLNKIQPDMVNHPAHYTAHPSGIEAIEVTEHMNFCLGNAIKYIWRADEKGCATQDLEKARWYIDREIQRRKTLGEQGVSTGQR